MKSLNDDSLRWLAWSAVAIMIAGSFAGILVPAGLGWDFANFYDAGHKAAVGQLADLYDPTARIAGHPALGKMKYWSPPLSAYLFAPLSALPPLTALIVFKVQNALAYAVALVLLFREYRWLSPGGPREQAEFAALYAVSALLFQPFWTVFRVGGQTTPTVFLLLVCALLLHTRGRYAVSAALVVAACALKPAFAPALAILALLSGPVFIGWAVTWAGGLAVVSILLLGWPIHAEFLRVVAGGGYPAPWYYNSAPTVLAANRILLRHPGPDLPYTLLAWGIRGAAVLAIVYVLWKTRSLQWTPAARNHFHFVIAVLGCLLLANIAWEHYLTNIFPLLAFLLAQRARLGRGARALLAAAIALALVQNMILVDAVRSRFTFDGHVELLLAGVIKSATLWLTALLLVRYHRQVCDAYETAHWSEVAALDRSESKLARA